jgi:stage V sporulation protein D (sporulation-specific penicillin-binding protein)
MDNKLSLNAKKKLLFGFVTCFFIIIILIIRVAYIQLFNPNNLKEKAEAQQSSSRNIQARRGTIFDATGENILAVSSSVETVTINPVNISKENKEKVAQILSEIFELDYNSTLKKVNKNSSIEYIAKRVEKEKTNRLREWMDENNILIGINIDEDSKRYYPYSNLACHVIGFCGSDNQGLDGIEAKYDSILQGENGEIDKLVDAKGNEFGTDGESYVSPTQGKNLILTIDMNIQSIAEKYLEEACIDNICTDGGNVIIMSPKTGDILAMATYPYYDLNNPFTINNEELLNDWSLYDQTEKSNFLQAMWRNKAIADTYEPGSTFKLVTASASLEEGIASPDKEGAFLCSGSIEIAGRKIKCWRYYRPHGSQSLRQALMNSCNPVFIGLGQKIGISKYYEYLTKFGFLRKTGIDLPGEAGSIFLKEEKVGPVELATISFGQRFEVTPIQMITMVSTIANNGKYVYPRIVKAIQDPETGITEEIEPKFGDQVISESTSSSIRSMMTSVVAEGTGKNAQVQGYNVGGKTGTSEDGVNTGKYVASFIGMVPTEDPEITILVTLYNPTGEGGHQGGGVAAPVAGKILNEVISYLELNESTINMTQNY